MANANRRRDVDRAGRQEKGAAAQAMGDVRYVMGDQRGRAWVWRILERTGVERGVQFSTNAMDLAHSVGVQEVGHALLAAIREACPETELIMRREAADRAARAQLTEDAQDDD